MIKPADLIATGWTFGGWYKEKACTNAYDFNSAVTANLTIYAKWTQNSYTVKFDVNGHGTAPANQTVKYGAKAAKPADLTAAGWIFGGWYKEKACTNAYDFNSAVTGNLTIYAKWTQNTPTPTQPPTQAPTQTPTQAPTQKPTQAPTQAPKSIADCVISGIAAKTYTGKAQTQSIVVKYGSTTLKLGTDYTVAYKNNVNVGTATVTITGKGDYTGSVSKTFKINAVKISACTIGGIKAKTYTGKAQTQSITVKYGSKTLKLGTDYTVAYKNNTKVGTATVTITGKGNYTGSVNKAFAINKIKMSACTIAGIKAKTYNGKAQTQSITVKNGTATLKLGTHYTVAYKNNKNAGTATMTITGKGNFTGSVSKTFKINKAANPITVKSTAKTVAYKTVKSKAVTGAPLTVTKAQGAVSYKLTKKHAVLTVNAKTGKVTVKKGTYTAKGNANYKSATKTATVKITVK